MRGLRIVHQPALRAFQRIGQRLARLGLDQSGDQPLGRIVAVGDLPMAGDHRARAGADERANQTVERIIAAGHDARFSRGAGGCRAGGVAGRQDDDIGVELEVENLAEAQ